MEEDGEKRVRLTKKEKKDLKFQRLKEKYKQKKKSGPNKKKPKRKPAPLEQADPKFHVAFEILGGPALMTDKELRSLALQVRYSYAANRISQSPISIYVTNFALIETHFPKEYASWKNVLVSREPAESLGFSSITVLTADAEDTLKDLEENTLYVIGGLVDRNRHRGYTEKIFTGRPGTRTAKLPITQTLSSSKVLSCLHVFSILLAYSQSRSWGAAISAHIPERKQKKTPVTPVNNATSSPDGEEKRSAME